MVEQSAFDRNAIEGNILNEHEGLLEQLNLPPALITFLRAHQRIIWIIVTCIVTAVTVGALYGSYRTHTMNKAASALDAAMIAEGNQQELLQQVIDEFGASPAALLAKVELAHIAADNNDRTQAIVILNEVNSGLPADSLLKPLVGSNLAGLYEQEGSYTNALLVYEDLATVEGFEADAYKGMGFLHEQLGNTEKAVTMYTKYLELTTPENGAQADPKRDIIVSKLNKLQK